MRFRFASFLIAMVCLTHTLPAAAAGNRVAVVIGNAKYPDAEAPLKEPITDARDIADELKRDGFDVEVGENLSGDAMRRMLDRFYARVKPGASAVIFFSGIGIQSARQSYMIPVDAQIWTEPDVRRDGIALETVLGEVNTRGAGVKIALLDASRRNPFERRFRSFSAGLAPVVAPNGSLVMYSAALSSVVSDPGTPRSTFVSELLKEIRVPDLTAEETLNRTRVAVIKASRSEQVPWISSSLAEDFSFIPGQRLALTAKAPIETPPVALIAKTEPAKTEPGKTDPGKTDPAKTDAAKTESAKAPDPKPAEVAAKPSPTVSPVETTSNPPPPAKTAIALADDPTIKTLNGKLATNPDDVSALYRRGQVYASKGAYALAIKDFDDTIRINPKDVEAYNNRCWTRAVIGELPAALKDCNEALRLRPNFVDALDSRGLVNLKNGQVKNAIADFDAALKINPQLTSSLYGRGLARKRNGAVTDGDIDIANAKAMDPDIVTEFDSYGVR